MKIKYKCTDCNAVYNDKCPNNHSILAAIGILICEKCGKEFPFSDREKALECCAAEVNNARKY